MRADAAVPYGRVVENMGVPTAGLQRIGLWPTPWRRKCRLWRAEPGVASPAPANAAVCGCTLTPEPHARQIPQTSNAAQTTGPPPTPTGDGRYSKEVLRPLHAALPQQAAHTVRNYTINDMLTRYLRMNGYNVLMPMAGCWPACRERRLKNGVLPVKWTYENIAYMKSRCRPWAYYRLDAKRHLRPRHQWNQWLFLKMLEKGIAYRKTQVVNWDPVDRPCWPMNR